MKPFVGRATRPIERLGAVIGDEVYFDPRHPDVVILYRPLHIRVSGALLNMVEDGALEDISPSDGAPSLPAPVLSLSSARARPGRLGWGRQRPPE